MHFILEGFFASNLSQIYTESSGKTVQWPLDDLTGDIVLHKQGALNVSN